MADFNVRSDSVNVEQIMEQIRTRIREKRGVDYTEQQLRELAAVKLEKFLDPRGVRSDLLQQFKRRQSATIEPLVLPLYQFEDTTIYETHRGILRFIRRLLNPILKLFFNPNELILALHKQTKINAILAERDALREHQRQERREMDALYYEVIHNLVVEMTRIGIDTKNVKMRVESIGSRLEFNERRARALESAVVYKPSSDDAMPEREPVPAPARRSQPSAAGSQGRGEAPPAAAPPSSPASSTGAAPVSPTGSGQAPSTGSGQGPSTSSTQGAGTPEGPGQRSRRRRRRRGRRGGASAVAMMGPGQPAPSPSEPPGPDQTASPGPIVPLEQVFAADGVVQPAESRADAPATTPRQAPAPESDGPAPDLPGNDDQQ
jgi:hypothetical protein